MRIAYTAGIYLYFAGIRLASMFLPKARKWISGRRNLLQSLPDDIGSGKWVWFHAASLGEFEQGRPLIEMIKLRSPETKIILTFFSPSGFEVRKTYALADHVCYMPPDTPSWATKFVDAVNPSLAIFIKYELWYHHLAKLQERNIPMLLISAQFRGNQFYFKRIGSFFLPVLKGIDHIFTADTSSARVLTDNAFVNVSVTGDTRIDRVLKIIEDHRDFSQLKNSLIHDIVIVAGSTWPRDEDILIEEINTGERSWIIAPHELGEKRLQQLESRLSVASARVSNLKDNNGPVSVLILDTMGDLSHVYHLADIAYVGGGFDHGIHNILEPAAYKIPVLFGPNHQRFHEATELKQVGAARAISDTLSLQSGLLHYLTPEAQAAVASSLESYFTKHQGATARIYDYIHRENLI